MWTIRVNADGERALLHTDENGVVKWVPVAPGNRHYEEYRQWLSEGNEPGVIEEGANE